MSATDFELYTEIEWTGVKIKECPFCGSAGQLYQYKAGPNVYQKVVMCTNDGGDDENGECPMYMPPDGFYRATKKEAIEKWNHRANSDEHGEERDRLLAMVAELACKMCGGHGQIGGLLPGDGGYDCQTCPDCGGTRINPSRLVSVKADAVREAVRFTEERLNVHVTQSLRLYLSRSTLLDYAKHLEAEND